MMKTFQRREGVQEKAPFVSTELSHPRCRARCPGRYPAASAKKVSQPHAAAQSPLVVRREARLYRFVVVPAVDRDGVLGLEKVAVGVVVEEDGVG